MKTVRFLSMAALVVMGTITTSCDKMENDNGSHGSVYTMTLHMGAGTKTVIDASTGAHTFKAGDRIAVIYTNTSSETVKATSNALEQDDLKNGNRSAEFTVALNNPDNMQPVTYIYPAAMANADGSVNYDALKTQDGLLTSLAGNLDLCTSSGAWVNGTDLPSLTLENQLAILAVTLKDLDGSSEITGGITRMTLCDGTYGYAVARPAAAGPIYVAIRPVTSANIMIMATDGTNTYVKSLTAKTYSAGNGYNVSWRMLVPEAVDLGLPSGVKWASFNVGATVPEEYGAYFAWGETVPKSNHTWETYKFRVSGNNYNNVTFSRYCPSEKTSFWGSSGSPDNKASLADYGYEDDAARANWGGKWRMPTKAEFEELIANCYCEWDTFNHVKGYLFTSKTNYNSIFLPAAGFRIDTSVNDAKTDGFYWSSSLRTEDPVYAWSRRFDKSEIRSVGSYRYYGRSVRPVFTE